MFILSVFEKIVNSSHKFLIMCILVNILSIHLGRKTPIKNSHHNENISCPRLASNTAGSGKIE